MNELLSSEQIEDFKARAAATEHPRELALDVLRAIQGRQRWVSDAGVELTAEILGLTPLLVEELATFYDKIYRQPVGLRVIHLCDSICCWSLDAEGVYRHLQQTLGISFGETTADGAFTLLPTCCLGACGEAPAMLIGLTTYGRLTPARIDEILAAERAALDEEEKA